MEENACIWFKPPTQTPCDVLICLLGIGCNAFDAVLPKPGLGIKPLLGGIGVKTRAE